MSSAASSAPTIRLFSSDLDGTLLGNPESARRFKTAWDLLPRRDRPLLVYNTGRLVEDVRSLVDRGELPAPGFHHRRRRHADRRLPRPDGFQGFRGASRRGLEPEEDSRRDVETAARAPAARGVSARVQVELVSRSREPAPARHHPQGARRRRPRRERRLLEQPRPRRGSGRRDQGRHAAMAVRAVVDPARPGPRRGRHRQ